MDFSKLNSDIELVLYDLEDNLKEEFSSHGLSIWPEYLVTYSLSQALQIRASIGWQVVLVSGTYRDGDLMTPLTTNWTGYRLGIGISFTPI